MAMPRVKSLSKKLAVKLYLDTHFTVSSLAETFRTKRKSNLIHENRQPAELVVVMALYEKGLLRKDVEKFLTALKKKGAMIIAANTSALAKAETERVSHLIDVYIERDNLGRDFGSYKECFDYFYQNKINQHCKRLIICNDSVFYSTDGLDVFIEEMVKTKKNVLGATENHDIERHLGSFFISVSEKVVNSKKFIDYWSNYKKTNVRPKIIKNGELGLSRVLKSLSCGDDDFVSLYNAHSIEKQTTNIRDIIKLISLMRDGDAFSGSSISLQDRFCENIVIDSYFKKYMKGILILKHKNYYLNEDYYNDEMDNGSHFISFLEWLDHLAVPGSEPSKDLVTALKSVCIELIVQGSQIHLNGLVFRKMGLPIIKLDLLYRCAYSMFDIIRLSELISDGQEAEEFKKIIFARPAGKNFHFGFKKLAFKHGYI
ncbi:hypothetical protein EHW65_03115 [Erwinia psidii]|nr:hypothetical protein [Erwinia psidii]